MRLKEADFHMSRVKLFGVKVSKLSSAILMIAFLAVLISGCSRGLRGSITASGSTALQPLVQQAAERFMSKNPGARIIVTGGGSGTGLSQVAQGQVDIGNSDIFAEEKPGIDASTLKDHRVAVVAFAVVVHPSNPVDNLSTDQLVAIFTGKTANWKDVGGKDMPIIVVNRPKSSGTRATFNRYALMGAQEAETGLIEDSSGQVKKIVSETPGAISYLAISYVDSSVKALKVNGVAPTVENVTHGTYPVWSYEHMYTKGEPAGLTKAFLDYMLSPEVQNDLVPKLGYIPVTSMMVTRNP